MYRVRGLFTENQLKYLQTQGVEVEIVGFLNSKIFEAVAKFGIDRNEIDDEASKRKAEFLMAEIIAFAAGSEISLSEDFTDWSFELNEEPYFWDPETSAVGEFFSDD